MDGVYNELPKSTLSDLVDNTMRVEGAVTEDKTKSGSDRAPAHAVYRLL